MRESSLLAIILGIVIGGALAAANTFVGLKIGMTISASIPAAVVSMLIMRSLLKRGSILENNIVQTIGSAGESAAAGMIFTLPALFIMGNDPMYAEMVIWGAIGGMLGVCFMVPLRNVLIVREHGKLAYPEGVACAEVLESGDRGGSAAKPVIWGAVLGGVYYLLNGLGFWKETATADIKRFRTEGQLDASPALLGVGYILGIRVAAYMLAGAILSWFVLIPGIGFFGAGVAGPVFPAKTGTIAGMKPWDIYDTYIRHVGAGAVAIGGLISLFKSFPTIVSSMWHVAASVFGSRRGKRDRTEKDFPMILLLLIIVGIGYAMWHFKQVRLDHYGVLAVLVFTFFFVTVSSRLVGIVGSSSNPVSGMTIATLLATALVYKFFVVDRQADMTEEAMTTLKVTCLSVGAIVCVAISVAGDCSQDLKTGFLVKATPYKQQIGEMIGVLTSVAVIAGVLILLNNTMGFEKTPEQPYPLLAPQANIMKILVEGVLGGNVPWTLIMMGGATAVIVEMLGLPALPFAVGMYLPLGLSTPIMVGGIIRWLVDRKRREKSDMDPGVLAASGLVAGKGLMGVALAGVLALISWIWSNPHWINPISGASEPVSYAHLAPWLWSKIGFIDFNWGLPESWWNALPVAPFLVLVIWLWWMARKRPAGGMPSAARPAGPAPEPAPKPTEPPSIPVVPPRSPQSTSERPSSTFGPPEPVIPPAPKPKEEDIDSERARVLDRLGPPLGAPPMADLDTDTGRVEPEPELPEPRIEEPAEAEPDGPDEPDPPDEEPYDPYRPQP